MAQEQRHDHHDHPHDDHGHTHVHGGHSHQHRGGVLGWLQQTFAHSHDAHEKVDAALETNEEGIRTLKISLVGLAMTAILQVVIVAISGSTALLADTIHNFGDATTAIPLWIAFALMRRGQTRRFTYGFGRAEDVAGVMIVALIFFSACVAGYVSFIKIINPHPITHVWWVMTAGVIGFIGNEAVAVLRMRTGRRIGSAALIADGQHARVDGFTSLAVVVGTLGVAAGVPLLDPIIGLLITIAILFIVKDAGISIFRRMLDGIEPEILAEVEHAPMHVEAVEHVRARWLGHKMHADLKIVVDRDLSVSAAAMITAKVTTALADHVPAFGDAVIAIVPAT